jgi:hypothetical protein
VGLPPRPDKAPRPLTIEPAIAPPPPPANDTEPSPAMPAPAELDEATRKRVAAAIARAITAELGTVRISSVPPESGEPPRSSMRAAARGAGKVGKWGVLASGALSLIGTLIAWWRPEYAGPIAQAFKLIAAAILAAAGGGAPAADAAPARDAPALVAPAPAPPAPDAVP